MSVQCNGCQKEVMWKKPYTQGDKPVEMDGSAHTCPARQSKKSGIARHPIGQAPEFLEMACTLLETLEEKQKLNISSADKAATIATLFDTVSRSFSL